MPGAPGVQFLIADFFFILVALGAVHIQLIHPQILKNCIPGRPLMCSS